MTNTYRRLAVFVDRPSPESFLWIILESSEDPAVWLDLETGDQNFDNWLGAYEAGNSALLSYVEDQLLGPLSTPMDAPDVEDE